MPKIVDTSQIRKEIKKIQSEVKRAVKEEFNTASRHIKQDIQKIDVFSGSAVKQSWKTAIKSDVLRVYSEAMPYAGYMELGNGSSRIYAKGKALHFFIDGEEFFRKWVNPIGRGKFTRWKKFSVKQVVEANAELLHHNLKNRLDKIFK